MDFLNEHITVDAAICNGKPTIRGKRITVQTILEYLSAGDTSDDILREYPSLNEADIAACLKFASQLMNHRYVIYPLASETV